MSTGGANKRKGSANERVLCSKLSVWVTGGKDSTCFWRSSMSGGRSTIRLAKGQSAAIGGDITAVKPEGHILTDSVFIEAKHLKDAELTSFLLKGTGETARAWEVCTVQAERHRKLPLLVVRQDRFPTFAVFRPCQFEERCPVRAFRPGAAIVLLDDLLALPFGPFRLRRDIP